jgi:acyl dehydratase
MSSLHFDDLEVGQALPALILPAIDRTTLARFAGASGDDNPIHVDIDFARRAGMPDVFAHGMLGMAYLGRLLTQWAPQSALRSFGVRFMAITHLGNTPVLSAKVTDKLETEGEKRVRLEVQMANQYGEVKVLGAAEVALS